MPAFSPRTLAERWACSERHVRNMVERGELPAFRLGAKLLRIRGEDVEALERQGEALPDPDAGAEPPVASGGESDASGTGGNVSESEAEKRLLAVRRVRMRALRNRWERERLARERGNSSD